MFNEFVLLLCPQEKKKKKRFCVPIVALTDCAFPLNKLSDADANWTKN